MKLDISIKLENDELAQAKDMLAMLIELARLMKADVNTSMVSRDEAQALGTSSAVASSSSTAMSTTISKPEVQSAAPFTTTQPNGDARTAIPNQHVEVRPNPVPQQAPVSAQAPVQAPAQAPLKQADLKENRGSVLIQWLKDVTLEQISIDVAARNILQMLSRNSLSMGDDLVKAFLYVFFDQACLAQRLESDKTVLPAVQVLMILPEMNQTSVKDSSLQAILKAFAIPRAPDCNRAEFFAFSEVFATMMEVDLIPPTIGLQALTRFLSIPQNRCAAITTLGKSVELCAEHLSDACDPQTLTSLKKVLDTVREDEYRYDVEYITENTRWSKDEDVPLQSLKQTGDLRSQSVDPNAPEAYPNQAYPVPVDSRMASGEPGSQIKGMQAVAPVASVPTQEALDSAAASTHAAAPAAPVLANQPASPSQTPVPAAAPVASPAATSNANQQQQQQQPHQSSPPPHGAPTLATTLTPSGSLPAASSSFRGLTHVDVLRFAQLSTCSAIAYDPLTDSLVGSSLGGSLTTWPSVSQAVSLVPEGAGSPTGSAGGASRMKTPTAFAIGNQPGVLGRYFSDIAVSNGMLYGVLSPLEHSASRTLGIAAFRQEQDVGAWSAVGVVDRNSTRNITCLKTVQGTDLILAGEVLRGNKGPGSYIHGVCVYSLGSMFVRNEAELTLAEHQDVVTCVADRKTSAGVGAPLFASGSRDSCIKIWDPRQQCSVAMLGQITPSAAGAPNSIVDPSTPSSKSTGHQSTVTGIAFQDNALLSCGLDRQLLLWDLRRISEDPMHSKPVKAISLAANLMPMEVQLGSVPQLVAIMGAEPASSLFYLSLVDESVMPVCNFAHCNRRFHHMTWNRDKSVLFAVGDDPIVDCFRSFL